MKHVHLIGIGGSGLSAIARLLLESGYVVSGSDQQLSNLALDLQLAGAVVTAGHSAQNISGADLVVRSSAIPDNNPEVQAARAANIPVLKRSEFLGQFMENHAAVAVAGTHGKTTTTAMIAWMLSSMGQDPSYIIGGISKNLGTNAHAGKGSVFVIEADEYDRMFLGLKPEIAVVTTLEHDHPDCYPTLKEYREAFVEFISSLRPGGMLLVCADDAGAAGLIAEVPARRRKFTYGLDPCAVYHASSSTSRPGIGFSFIAEFQISCGAVLPLGQVSLTVPGEHNVRNAMAALAVAHCLGLPLDKAVDALQKFSGTGRRFDVLGEIAGITIIDDYGHHPTEIRTTLAAARTRYPGQHIWAVWQPHTYSRTLALQEAFIQSFGDADRVIVTEIYASREKTRDYSSARLVNLMDAIKTTFAPTHEFAAAYLLQHLKSGDVLIVLSAGDADQISCAVLNGLKEKNNAKL